MAIFIPFLMLFLMFAGMPIGFALGVTGVVGIFFADGWGAVSSILSTTPFRTAASITLTAVPMFILMSEFIARSNIADELFDAAHKWLERLPGGLAIASVFASAGMAAMSGSSTASAAALSKVCIPQLTKHGYNQSIAAGVVTVSGTLSVMIPPSLAFVLYGIITETSIGKLLIAGVVPGILTAIMYILGILLWGKVSPGIIPPPTRLFTSRERWASLRPLWAFIILISVVIGSIYSGLATTTEAAAFGAFAALIIGLLMRRIKRDDINKAAMVTIETTAMIFTIVIGAMILGYFLTISQAAQNLIELISALAVPPWVIMGFLIILYLILGALMDELAILFITLPLVFPLIIGLGYDPIWFGVIIVKLIQIGLVAPPVGMNAFVVSATAKVPLDQVYRGSGMLLTVEIITLIILLAFPEISTWLPSIMNG